VIEALKKRGIIVSPSQTNAKAIALVAIALAQKGDVNALRIITQQTELPLAQAIELYGQGGGPIVTETRAVPTKEQIDAILAKHGYKKIFEPEPK
jgi:hypothetical protein